MPKPDYTSLVFPGPPRGRPYVVVNMVMSADGNVTVEDNEKGLGSPADQRLMRELRVHADVVLDGAGTLRESGASPRLGDERLEMLRLERGKARLPVIATVSASGRLPLDRIFFTADDFRAVVYAGHGMPADALERLRATGRTIVSLPPERSCEAMVRHMREELDCRLLLCEGGPTLNRGLLDDGVVDEIFLTIGPAVVGGRKRLGPVGGETHYALGELPRLELLHAVPNESTSEIYLRYRVAASPGSRAQAR